MTKREKFISNLDTHLGELENKNVLIDKYEKIIDKELNKNIKIGKILKNLGSPEKIAEKEINTYLKKIKYKNILNTFFKSSKKVIVNTLSNTSQFYKIVFKNLKRHDKKKKVKRIKNRIKDKVNDIKIKEKKVKKSKFYWLITIFEILLFIILFYVSVLFMASLFAILDKVKFYGLSVFLLLLVILLLVTLKMLDNKRFNIYINHTKYFIIYAATLICLSFSVGYIAYNYSKLEHVSDVSEKYAQTYQTLEYRFSKNKDLNICFNSWYKTSYIVEIDDTLENKVKIDLKYYEAFYDLNAMNEGSNIYISLGFDTRDLISVYLENLKDNKIYNEKELSRYTVKIYVSEKNKERLIIHN